MSAWSDRQFVCTICPRRTCSKPCTMTELIPIEFSPSTHSTVLHLQRVPPVLVSFQSVSGVEQWTGNEQESIAHQLIPAITLSKTNSFLDAGCWPAITHTTPKFYGLIWTMWIQIFVYLATWSTMNSLLAWVFILPLLTTFQCAAPITPSASSAAVSSMTVMLMCLVGLRLESLGLRRFGFFGVCRSVMCGWWCSLRITRVSGC